MKRGDRFLRTYVCQDRLGDSNSAFYDKQKRGLLPKVMKRGKRASGLFESEVDAVLSARARGSTDEQMRELSKLLEALRVAPIVEADTDSIVRAARKEPAIPAAAGIV